LPPPQERRNAPEPKPISELIKAYHDIERQGEEQSEKLAIANTIEKGRLLIAMKEQVLGHGEFGPWLKEHFRTKTGKRLSDSTAQNYMNLADFAERHTGFHRAQLSLRLAFDLARKAKMLKKPERPLKPRLAGDDKKDGKPRQITIGSWNATAASLPTTTMLKPSFRKS
jgi:Protein of unknown function (DUF3102)